MPTLASPRPLRVNDLNGVAVVTLAADGVLTEAEVQGAVDEVGRLVTEEGRRHLLLDLTPVTCPTSQLLAKLIGLSKQVKASGGRLAVCGVGRNLHAVFSLLHLPQIIPTYDSLPEALQSFAGAGR
jgi:anti-sigma B factor antagonist